MGAGVSWTGGLCCRWERERRMVDRGFGGVRMSREDLYGRNIDNYVFKIVIEE